jgi:hypothetical protein
MSKALTNATYQEGLHGSIAETAQAVVAGTLGVVAASRRFVGFAAELGMLNDDDFLFFLNLDSDSDHFPLGVARDHWSTAALEREDLALHKYEAAVHSEAVAHCRRLVSKYTRPASAP